MKTAATVYRSGACSVPSSEGNAVSSTPRRLRTTSSGASDEEGVVASMPPSDHQSRIVASRLSAFTRTGGAAALPGPRRRTLVLRAGFEAAVVVPARDRLLLADDRRSAPRLGSGPINLAQLTTTANHTSTVHRQRTRAPTRL